MVFAVNPESCVDRYVYPLAENFEDFLRLILVSGSTTAIEQIIGWNAEQFGEFVQSDDNRYIPGQEEVLEIIQKELNLKPMNGSFEYVKNIQKEFDDSKIIYSNEYYDTLGYVPSSALLEDIKKLTDNPSQVLAILEKEINENIYKTVKHVAKGLNLNNLELPDEIKILISLEKYVYKGK